MLGRRVPAVAIVLLVTAAGILFAETWKGQELERKWHAAAWKFGPFRIQPSLVISNAGVDSNLYYSADEPIKDFTITAGPAATVYVPIHRRFVLSLYGSPQYIWYSKTDRERTWNYYFNGAAQLSLKNVFFSLEGTYSDARERWNTEIDIRPRRKEEGYGGSVLVKTSRKTSVSLAYRTSKYYYESVVYGDNYDVRERLNRQESWATFSAFYQAGSQKRFFLDLEYGLYEFEFATQAAIGDAQSGAAYAGLEFPTLGRRIRGRIRVGYKKFDIRNPEVPDNGGIVGDSQLSVRLAKPFVLRGSYRRDIWFSLWYENPYYVETRPGVGVSFYPVKFLRFDYDYSLGRNIYPVAHEVLPGEEVKRRDEYSTHSTAIYFRIKKNVGLGFIASWWARKSNLSAEDDKRTFFGLNLTYEF
ncbi:MAG: outer membrane beta-barrel protein [Planctomycetes bacterium]|nr:outer membrane beta-barrel protein [Planctomycetota bacterium]